jgi:hypothetical protein
VCKVQGSYPALGSVTGTVGSNAAGNPTISITLDPGPPRDVFFFKLVANAGVFTGASRPGRSRSLAPTPGSTPAACV